MRVVPEHTLTETSDAVPGHSPVMQSTHALPRLALSVSLALAGCSGAADATPANELPTTPAPADVAPPTPPAQPVVAPRVYVDLALGLDMACGVLEGGRVRCHRVGASFDVDVGGAARAVALGREVSATHLYVLRADGVVVHARVSDGALAFTPVPELAGASAIVSWAEGACAIVEGAVRCFAPNDRRPLTALRLPGPARTLVGDPNSGCVFAWGTVQCRDSETVPTCAQLDDARVFCWARSRPRPSEARALAGAQSFAVHRFERVWIAGDGTSLGYQDPRTPGRERSAPRDAAQVVGGAVSACYLDGVGGVSCRGVYVPGEPVFELVPLRGLPRVRRLVRGGGSVCALTDAGAWCWGSNWRGRLGVPSPETPRGPTTIAAVSGAAALFVADATACARPATGDLVCWGAPLAGFGEESWPPPAVHPLPGVRAIAGATASGVLLTSSGGVRGFGALSPRYYAPSDAPAVVVTDDDLHEWATRDVDHDATPAELQGLEADVTAVSGQPAFACATTRAGALVCVHRSETHLDGAAAPTLASATTVLEAGVTAAGPLGRKMCARDASGMRCFEVVRSVDARGPPGGTVQIIPAAWPFDTPADAWAGHGRYACGLFGTRAQCRGAGSAEQELTDVTAIDVGLVDPERDRAQVCAVTLERGVSCLALGSAAARPTPVEGLTDVVELRLGRGFGCARRVDGSVACWGRNDTGVMPNAGEHARLDVPTRIDEGEP